YNKHLPAFKSFKCAVSDRNPAIHGLHCNRCMGNGLYRPHAPHMEEHHCSAKTSQRRACERCQAPLKDKSPEMSMWSGHRCQAPKKDKLPNVSARCVHNLG